VLEQRLVEVKIHPPSAEAVQRFHYMVHVQREALEARLLSLGSTAPGTPTIIASAPFLSGMEMRHNRDAHAVSRGLHALYTAFNHATLGYAMLHAVAHRFFDSQTEGNTADLAERHLRGYAAAVQEINQLISDVVVWELSQAGQECQCLCPSCSLGVCLCAPHGTITVNEAWRETTPSVPPDGLVVRLPRAQSAAARAGLHAGDRIVAIDDQHIVSDLDAASMQNAVRMHQPGEAIRLRVRRGAGEPLDITVTRSEPT
jgi:hypothetical protein